MQPVKRPSDRRRDGLGSDKRTPRLQVNPGRWHSHWRGFLMFLLVLLVLLVVLDLAITPLGGRRRPARDYWDDGLRGGVAG